MTIGIGILGRAISATIGGEVIPGIQSKGLEHSNTRLDTTDDQANGWAESMAVSGEKSVSGSFSGITKNLGLMQSYYGSSQAFEIIFTYPDGSTVTADFFMDSFSNTGEHSGLTTFDASFSSTGAVVFVAGT